MPAPLPTPITILGTGAMGTVCALILANQGHPVRLWGHNPAHVSAVHTLRHNPHLPGITLPTSLHFTADSTEAFAAAPHLLLCAIPTQFIRAVLSHLKAYIPAKIPILSVSKGIELDTLLRPTQIIDSILGPRPLSTLSGPSIAGEIARNLPATMVVASPDESLAHQVQTLFSTRTLRVYRNMDLVGVELAGALKNVIALAAGILDGMDMGNNAKAALMTRGLVEITRLGVALGAQPETFAGLAGLGDLVTTCFSPEGRNRNFGFAIGRGETIANALASSPGIVEGMPTCKAVVGLAKQLNVEMPLSEMLHAVLFDRKPPAQGIRDLMSREPKSEGIWQ